MRKSVALVLAIALFSRLEADFTSSYAEEVSGAKVFSARPQVLLPGEPILLEKISSQSPAIDLSLASSGIIIFKRSGVYKIIWHGQAHSLLRNQWTLGFSLDGLIIFGNLYGSSDRHAIDDKVTGSVVLSINAGQVLRLVNASLHPVELIPKKNNSKSPLASFTVSLLLFEVIYSDQYRNNLPSF